MADSNQLLDVHCRTALSDVGKTLGSNKYVAGAAAASALAALGLAVSKIITVSVFLLMIIFTLNLASTVN